MKKKYIVPSKDKKDWIDFTKEMGSIRAKDDDFLETYQGTNKARKLDLHGYYVQDAWREFVKFVHENKHQKGLPVNYSGISTAEKFSWANSVQEVIDGIQNTTTASKSIQTGI